MAKKKQAVKEPSSQEDEEEKPKKATKRFREEDYAKLQKYYSEHYDTKEGNQEDVFRSFGKLHGYSVSQVQRAHYRKQKKSNNKKKKSKTSDNVEKQEFEDRFTIYAQEMDDEENKKKKRKTDTNHEPKADDEDSEHSYETESYETDYLSDEMIVRTPSKLTKTVNINDETTSLFRPYRFENASYCFFVYRYPTWTSFLFDGIDMSKKVKTFSIIVTIHSSIDKKVISDSFPNFASGLVELTERKDEKFTIYEPIPKGVDVKSVKSGLFELQLLIGDNRVFMVFFEKKVQKFQPSTSQAEFSKFLLSSGMAPVSARSNTFSAPTQDKKDSQK
ncbi:predicted protein [Naegleria gruberi]|uniref:Predicted protein n=1 Tax=Naegleria gruberi TaxID=5762 RepID=D2V1F5_NAEGR|nr:uncharacterized protein NAEGRDRAFT_62561 [Naegleria gruberi]EFC49158.1 predicted protein [Naegleria gruberi]|eukprot:XP_002681902.1 predicted protein [Naegleria gruberi strain NEG-M]